MGKILEKLWDEHGIVWFCVSGDPDEPGPHDHLSPVPSGMCLVIDSEHYSSALLTKEELLALADEINELAEGL